MLPEPSYQDFTVKIPAKTLDYIGRKKPYTAIGIKRCRCVRCGSKAISTWEICANDSRHVPLCNDCDIQLNRLVLEFMRFPNIEALMEAYK